MGKHSASETDAPAEIDEPASAEVEAPVDGRQARWARHNSERRQRIIDAAIEVIAERGGAELHVQQIAQRAGLSRTVVYRHFEDRADLDRAIQTAILDRAWTTLRPEFRLEGTVPDMIERIIGTYVGWATANPALHKMADYDNEPDGPLEKALDEIAGQLALIISTAILGMGARLSEEDAAALEPLSYGIVGSVFGAVRRWLSRPEPFLTAERLVEMTSQSVWFVIDGHARRLGVQVDPRRSIEELLG